MNITGLILSLKSSNNEDVATLIYDFFLYQYNLAVVNEIKCQAEIDKYISIKKSLSLNDDIGFDVNLRYNEYSLSTAKTNLDLAKKQKDEAKLVLDFVVKRFISRPVRDIY